MKNPRITQAYINVITEFGPFLNKGACGYTNTSPIACPGFNCIGCKVYDECSVIALYPQNDSYKIQDELKISNPELFV